MQFNTTLIPAKIIARHHRIILDVMLRDGTIVPAYCPDFSDIKNLYNKDAVVWLSLNNKKHKNLKYVCELVTSQGNLICINNAHNYSILKDAFIDNKIEELSDYDLFADTKDYITSSLIDFKLKNSQTGKECVIGSASVYNKRISNAVFPTYLYFGEQKMLDEMESYASKGIRAVFILIVPRMDCVSTKFAWDIDPNSASLLLEYSKKNIEFISYSCFIDKEKIELDKKLPIIF